MLVYRRGFRKWSIVHTSIGPATGYIYVKRCWIVTNLQDETCANVYQCNYTSFVIYHQEVLAAKHPVVSKQAYIARDRICCHTLHGVLNKVWVCGLAILCIRFVDGLAYKVSCSLTGWRFNLANWVQAVRIMKSCGSAITHTRLRGNQIHDPFVAAFVQNHYTLEKLQTRYLNRGVLELQNNTYIATKLGAGKNAHQLFSQLNRHLNKVY